jgi:hypothetical protein
VTDADQNIVDADGGLGYVLEGKTRGALRFNEGFHARSILLYGK